MNIPEITSFRFIRTFAIGFLAVCATLPSVAANATIFEREHDEALFVLTDKGFIKGVETRDMNKFLGIPYAASPAGNGRWKAPQPAASWRNVRDATTFANHCPQNAGPFGLASANEDCLFLNVYTPSDEHGFFERSFHRDDHADRDRDRHNDHDGDRHDGRAVMLWIHGGALVTGESDDYDPTELVKRGVIVVTINYRLGILGYLAHPALDAEQGGASGNYGHLDQQAAIQWVKRNIKRFGGDPDNITIFGESAGGLSVHTQLASPLAAGLFQRAIIESGAYQLNTASHTTANTRGSGFATRAGCATAADVAACLRAVPIATLLADSQAGAIAAPNVDNKVLTQSIGAALTSGQFNHVPVMEGSNHDEWSLFVALGEIARGSPLTAAGYPAAVAGLIGPTLAPFAVAQYPLANFDSPSLALTALGTDVVFACNSRVSIRRLAKFVPVFGYEFNDENAPELFLPPVSFPYRAAHASEIQYLFHLRASVPNPVALDNDQQRLSRNMVRYWTHFAKTGDPNSRHTPAWPAYDPATDELQSLAPPTPSTETGFATAHKCAFWRLTD
jgi:para-nitrobenzyl esterase